jgi:hypothetical protein
VVVPLPSSPNSFNPPGHHGAVVQQRKAVIATCRDGYDFAETGDGDRYVAEFASRAVAQ